MTTVPSATLHALMLVDAVENSNWQDGHDGRNEVVTGFVQYTF